MRRIRIALFGAGGTVALLVGCAIVIISVLSSGWFKDQVRLRLIATIENASGGTVDLRSFDYDWRTLTGELQGFVVHGTEGAAEPPLLAASSVLVQLKIVSIFKRDIDLEQLVIDRPRIYISVRNDGTTNIPPPRDGRAETDLQDQLLKLAVRHFELRDGVAELNTRKIALSVRAQELDADIRYDASTPRYLASISSRQTRIQSQYSIPSATAFQARFQFSKDQIQVDQVMVSLPRSHVEGSGTLHRLTDLQAGFQLTGTLDLAEMEELFKQPILRAGTVAFSGQATYDRSAYRFSGSLQGRRISCGTLAFAVADAAIGSQILVNRDGITMSDLKVNALGAAFSGNAQLRQFQDLAVNVRSVGLHLREISRFFLQRPLGLDGIASGPVRIRGRLGKTAQDFVVTAEQEIQPGSQGTPISGAVELTYAQRGNLVQFGKAKLNLPNTTLDLSGILGETVHITVASTNLQDASPITALFTADGYPVTLPVRVNHGNLNFSGTVTGPLKSPAIDGRISGHNILYQKVPIDTFSSDIQISPDRLKISNAALATASLTLAGSGETALSNWVMERSSALRFQGALASSDLSWLAVQLGFGTGHTIRGKAKISAQISGTLANLKGTGTLTGTGLNANGQRIDSFAAQMHLDGDRLILEQGAIESAEARAVFAGAYRRTAPDWSEGHLDLKLDTDSFRLQDLASIQAFEPELKGQLQAHAAFSARVGQGRFALETVNGSASLKGVSFREAPFGNVDISANTSGLAMHAKFQGNLRDSQTSGNFSVDLAGDYRSQGTLRFSTIRFSTIKALIPSLQRRTVPFDGLLQGEVDFNGPLVRPKQMVASVRLSRLELTPTLQITELARTATEELTLRNLSPIVIDYRDGFAAVQNFRMNAKETSLEAGGRIALFSNSAGDQSGAKFRATAAAGVDFKVNGDLNLQVLQMLNPDLTAKGKSRINVTVSGTVNDPALNGSLELHEASFYLSGLTNGIEHAEGVVRFDRNRATVQKLTAQSGGGNLSITGFISFGEGAPMVYRLSANAQDLRIRYGGVSVSLDADLKYSGTMQSSALSGNLTVTKAAFNPSTDVASLFAATSEPAATPRADGGFLNHVRLEVNIQSSPSLQLTTSLSQDVQADIDLRLRGSPDRPAVLGRFSVNEGQIQFFGNKYTINRGEVNFYNPLKIQPELNLSLETQARGVTVNITVTGTLDKLNVSYRSDPPLQSNEIISLLATGKAPDPTSSSAGAQTVTQNSALGTGANTILGSAMSPVSSRLERFFGVTHLKIDPMLQGIENVPQARLTMEQQISKQITVTYVTNLSRTSEQIFRLEWALSREYSLIAIRDENGLFGIDVQYRRRFK